MTLSLCQCHCVSDSVTHSSWSNPEDKCAALRLYATLIIMVRIRNNYYESLSRIIIYEVVLFTKSYYLRSPIIYEHLSNNVLVKKMSCSVFRPFHLLPGTFDLTFSLRNFWHPFSRSLRNYFVDARKNHGYGYNNWYISVTNIARHKICTSLDL